MFRVVFGVLLAAMAYGWGWVDPGWADKLVQPLVFDGSATTVALSIYESTADNQADVVKALLKTSRSFYKPVGGFERFALLTSTDGSRIATLTQWQDAASYDAFQASLATAEDDEDYTKYYEKFVKERPGSSGLILDPPEPLLSATFTVDQTAAPPGMMPITIGENALVQMIDVAGRSPEDQGLMLDAARRSLDALPSLYPPPRSALVLQAIDAPYVALLANWGYATEFNDVSQLPLISLTMPSPEVAAAAEGDAEEAISQDASQAMEPSPQPVLAALEDLSLDDHLYQLAKVVAPKVSKYGAS